MVGTIAIVPQQVMDITVYNQNTESNMDIKGIQIFGEKVIIFVG